MFMMVDGSASQLPSAWITRFFWFVAHFSLPYGWWAKSCSTWWRSNHVSRLNTSRWFKLDFINIYQSISPCHISSTLKIPAATEIKSPMPAGMINWYLHICVYPYHPCMVYLPTCTTKSTTCSPTYQSHMGYFVYVYDMYLLDGPSWQGHMSNQPSKYFSAKSFGEIGGNRDAPPSPLLFHSFLCPQGCFEFRLRKSSGRMYKTFEQKL